jgi:hypothetical protein
VDHLNLRHGFRANDYVAIPWDIWIMANRSITIRTIEAANPCAGRDVYVPMGNDQEGRLALGALCSAAHPYDATMARSGRNGLV